jgi:hypothetical protein
MREEFQQTFDLRIFFTRCANELMKAADKHSFDLLILNVDAMQFASRLNYIQSMEFRKKKALDLVTQIHRISNSPVTILNVWGNPVFRENIAGARYAFELPCSIYEIREALNRCVTERFKEF